MRKTLFSVLFLLLFGAAAHAQKVNPKTQIGWPASCSVYDVLSGTCLGLQGTDSNVLSSGTVANTIGSPFCTDTVGGATTSDCLLASPVIVPPVTGQYVVVYPTSSTTTAGGTGPFCGDTYGGGSGPTGSVIAGDSSALLTVGPCGNTLSSNYWSATFSGFSLPSYVTPSNVTAVYAFAVSGYSAQYLAPGNSSGPGLTILNCGSFPWSVIPTTVTGNISLWPLQQTNTLTTITGAEVSSTTCTAEVGKSQISKYMGTLDVPAIGLIVYYTGTAPPAGTGTTLNVTPPLELNATTNSLGIDPNATFPGSSLEVTTVANLANLQYLGYTLAAVSNGISASDCATGGGTYPVLCYWNSSTAAWTGNALSPYAGAVTSVFGRTGAITSQAGDYNVTQVTNAASLSTNKFVGLQNIRTGSKATVGISVTPNPPYATPVVVQGYAGNYSAGAFSFASNPTAGNAILLIAGNDVISGVTDTQGNTYTEIASPSFGSAQGIWLATNIVGGADTITATGSVKAFQAFEISGLANSSTLDVIGTVVSGSSSTSPMSGGTITTTVPDIVFAFMQENSGGIGTLTASVAGFTNAVSTDFGFNYQGQSATLVGVANTYSAVWTVSPTGKTYYMLMFALKANNSSGSQTADLVQYQTSTGTPVSGVNGAGLPYTTPQTYSALTGSVTCASSTTGTTARVSDSTTTVAGATIAGSGSNLVGAVCNGTNWIVDGGLPGIVSPANGGTGQNNSSATGLQQWSSGTSSVSTALPNGTTATTGTLGEADNNVATNQQVVNAVAPLGSIYKLAGPLANTGNTTANQVGSIMIPAGALSATSQLWLTVVTDACTTASGVPSSACTGTVNTGTCSVAIKFNSSSTGGPTVFGSSTPLPATDKATFNSVTQNVTSSSQITVGAYMFGNSASHTYATGASAISTAGATYFNIFLINSVSSDTCFVDAAYVQVIP